MSYHQTTIIGNVGSKRENYTQDGTRVVNLNVAVNERWTDRQTNEKREKTTWYSASLWGNAANVTEYVNVGDQVMLVGNVSARAYTNNDGVAAASLDLRVQRLVLLRNGEAGSNNSNPANAGGTQPTPEDMNDIPF